MLRATDDAAAAQALLTTRAIAEADRSIERAALTTIGRFLDAARVAILGELRNVLPSTALTASGYANTGQAVDAATSAYNAWQSGLDATLLPAIAVAFGEGFNVTRQTAEYSPYRWQQDYMATVSDRLRIWPEGAMKELRPELLEALAEAETYEQMTERVGRVLGIDAPTRTLRAQITDVERRFRESDDPAERRDLRARRAELWQLHDDSLGEWQWKARRIARTEAHGAIVGGKLAAASARSQYTGAPMFKQWLSTDDERVRLEHRVADGQIVKLDESFRVGGFLIPFPAAPITIAPHQTIQCRCDVLVLTEDQMQRRLQTSTGPAGEIAPGNARVGPDNADLADVAIAELAEATNRPLPVLEQRGEDYGQRHTPGPGPEIAPDPDHVPESPNIDPSQYSDDELRRYVEDANRDDNHAVFDVLMAELDNRIADHARRAEQGTLDDLVDDTPIADDDYGDDTFADDLGDGDFPNVDAEPSRPWRPDDSGPSAEDLDAWSLDAPEPELSRLDRATQAFADASAAGVDGDTLEQLMVEMFDAEAEELRVAEANAELDRIADAIADLVAQGENEDVAESTVTGKSVQRIRRDRAMTEWKARGFPGHNFETMAAAAWREQVEFDYIAAEAATNGFMVKHQFEAHYDGRGNLVPGYDPMRLWMDNDATVRARMTDEMAAWFDEHGRLTKAVFIARIESGGTGPTGGPGQDYLQ